MVEIMFSAPAWKVTPRLMKQKRGSAPERHNAPQSVRTALSSVMACLQSCWRKGVPGKLPSLACITPNS